METVSVNSIQTRIEQLVKEKNVIINEINEITQALNVRQQRIVEINGALKSLQSIIESVTNNDIDEVNEDAPQD